MKADAVGGTGGRRAKGALSLSLLLLITLISCTFHVSAAISTSSDGDYSYNKFGENTSGAFKYKIIRRASTFPIPPRSSSDSSNNHHDVYDYIIVGGGTAGCPLAATLSEKYRVLVLERGGVPFNNMNVSYMQNFHINLADLSSTSASQFFMSTDGVLNSRARVLGGGSCINAGFYSRASSSFIRRVGWEPYTVNKSYQWVEKQIVRFPNLAPWQRAVRDGLMEAGVSPFNGFTYDHKYGTKVGGTIFEEDGRRRTAAELLASGNPKNLRVLVHATVQKILFNTASTSKKKPKAVGVLFKDEKGAMHEAYLSDTQDHQSEIILSSGAIGSPQMLLLSGIGPKSDLEKHDIQVVVDNKFVGKDIADNPLNTIFVPMKRHVNQSLIQTVGITKEGVYIEASSGFGSSSDTIQNHHHGAIEAIKAYGAGRKNPKKNQFPVEEFKGGFIIEKVAMPKSRGELHLNNTNPDDNPLITFNYFSHPDDLKRCVEGIRIIEKVVKSKSFSGFAGLHHGDLPFERILNMSAGVSVNLKPRRTNYETANLMQFCKDTVITIWHYHGGCFVGRVVDRDYKVLGVDRLRIIDGSTFSESPGTNPQATVMMMGRYMGLKILRERNSS